MRLRWTAVLAVAALTVAALAGSGAARAAGGKLAFSTAQAGPRNGGGEPSIATGPGRMLYVSWPGDNMGFASSGDGGRTWTQGGQPKDAGSVGDTSVNTDASGAVYETNLNVVNVGSGVQNSLQISLWKSFDKGATWPQEASGTLEPTNASGQPFFVDRQWTDAWIPPGKTTKNAIV